MSKMSDIDIEMQNAVDEGMKEFAAIKKNEKKEEKLRETMQNIFAQVVMVAVNAVPVRKLASAKKTVRIKPEIVTGVALILVAALFPVEDQNKIIFGFGFGIMYIYLVRDFVALIINLKIKYLSKQTSR